MLTAFSSFNKGQTQFQRSEFYGSCVQVFGKFPSDSTPPTPFSQYQFKRSIPSRQSDYAKIPNSTSLITKVPHWESRITGWAILQPQRLTRFHQKRISDQVYDVRCQYVTQMCYATFMKSAKLNSSNLKQTKVAVHPMFPSPFSGFLTGFIFRGVAVIVLSRL